MEIKYASKMGFCRGVSLSLDKVREAYELSQKNGLPCYIYGDIVHNSYVINELSSNGIKSILKPEDAECPGYLVIRAHGITDRERSAFKEAGFKIVDATCPIVLKNQNLARDSDRDVLIIGYDHHSEVIALLGCTTRPVYAIANPDALDALDMSVSYNAVLQTTFSLIELEQILSRAYEIGLDIKLLNTICNASNDRRKAVEELSRSVDAILVVGDKKSANTNELCKIAKAGCEKSFLVEKAEDIPIDVLECKRIGITAGASTPSGIYRGVEEFLRSR